MKTIEEPSKQDHQKRSRSPVPLTDPRKTSKLNHQATLSAKAKLEYENEIANLKTQLHDLAAQLLDQATNHSLPTEGNQPIEGAGGYDTFGMLKRERLITSSEEKLESLKSMHTLHVKQMQMSIGAKSSRISGLEQKLQEALSRNNDLQQNYILADTQKQQLERDLASMQAELEDLRRTYRNDDSLEQEKQQMQTLRLQSEEAIRNAQWYQERARSELQAQIKRNQELNSKLCSVQAEARDKEETLTATVTELERQLRGMAKAFTAQKADLE